MNANGINIVALSTDTVPQTAAGLDKHKLKGTFLSDHDLSVTDLFGLRNTNVAVKPPGVTGLPVPTTLLVDPAGKVLWKDQSEDYVRRSDPDVVRHAITQSLGSPAAASAGGAA